MFLVLFLLLFLFWFFSGWLSFSPCLSFSLILSFSLSHSLTHSLSLPYRHAGGKDGEEGSPHCYCYTIVTLLSHFVTLCYTIVALLLHYFYRHAGGKDGEDGSVHQPTLLEGEGEGDNPGTCRGGGKCNNCVRTV
jgi:hypothetical protein